jgi:hypothetical protein
MYRLSRNFKNGFWDIFDEENFVAEFADKNDLIEYAIQNGVVLLDVLALIES